MIRLDNLSKSFGPRVLFKGLFYHFPDRARVALFGANGAGKTTLLNIMMGMEEADSGAITQSKALRVGCLPQSPNPSPESTLFEECLAGHRIVWELRHRMAQLLSRMETNFQETDCNTYEELRLQYEQLDGYGLEGDAAKILEGLGFPENRWQEDPRTLSGGWRMRLELARLLISKPDFLILDEPTNHLDLPAIEWLEDFLGDFRGTVLFVTHDQALLESLPTLVLELAHGCLTAYTGNYTEYVQQKAEASASLSATVKKLTRERANKQRFVDRFGAKATKAAQASSRKKAIAKIDMALESIPQEKKEATIRFPQLAYPSSARQVLTLQKGVVGYQTPLLTHLHFSLMRGEKCAVVGPNGLGKSTLLKTFAREIPLLSGQMIWGDPVKVGFFQQDAAERLLSAQTIWNVAQEYVPDLPPPQLRALLGAFLFSGDTIEKPLQVLSGGERSRLAFCLLLARRPNCLLLDEPTNHLDLESKSILAQALKAYPGALVVVSHDRTFMETVADTLWNLQENSAS